MRRRRNRFVPFVLAALIVAGIAYPAMLLATGAAMANTSGTEAIAQEHCDEPEEATSETFPAGDAGTVTLERSGDGLRIDSVDEAGGWTSRTKEDGPGESVAVAFSHETGRVVFHASIVDCRVRIVVTTKLRSDLDGDTAAAGTSAAAAASEATVTQTFDAAEAGTVTLTLSDGKLEVDSVDPADGWTHKVRLAGPGSHVYVRFSGDDQRVHFHAKVKDDRMALWVRSVSFVDLGEPAAPAATETPAAARAVETTPPAPATPTSKPTSTPVAEETETETRTVVAGRAGTVTLKRSGETLEVLSADANDGWSSEITTAGPAEEVAVTFTHDRGFAFRLEAKVEDGRIRIHFEPDWSGIAPPPTPPEPLTFDTGRAGSITIERPGATLDRIGDDSNDREGRRDGR